MQNTVEIHQLRPGIPAKVFQAEVLTQNEGFLKLSRKRMVGADIYDIRFIEGALSANFMPQVSVEVHYNSENPDRAFKASARAHRINEGLGPVVKKYYAYFWNTKREIYI